MRFFAVEGWSCTSGHHLHLDVRHIGLKASHALAQLKQTPRSSPVPKPGTVFRPSVFRPARALPFLHFWRSRNPGGRRERTARGERAGVPQAGRQRRGRAAAVRIWRTSVVKPANWTPIGVATCWFSSIPRGQTVMPNNTLPELTQREQAAYAGWLRRTASMPAITIQRKPPRTDVGYRLPAAGRDGPGLRRAGRSQCEAGRQSHLHFWRFHQKKLLGIFRWSAVSPRFGSVPGTERAAPASAFAASVIRLDRRRRIVAAPLDSTTLSVRT